MKKSKKIISLLLSVLMIITSIPLMAVNSFAANSDFVINNYNGTVTVQKYTGSASYVSIPSGVTDISEFAFSGCNTVETIYIPQSVAKIGFARLVSNAFSGCLSLKEIIVADDNAYIGAYNTCKNGCKYCYANFSQTTVNKNTGLHNPYSPLLFGEVSPEDKITERKMVSLKNNQLNLF